MGFLQSVFGKVKIGKAVGDALKAQVIPALTANAKTYLRSRLYAIEAGLHGAATSVEIVKARKALAELLEAIEE